jgi:DNA-binding PadR family transcriptional regulator
MKPSSGYDLRKIFSSTSMKTYSGSPGAIYPAHCAACRNKA